MVEEQSKLVNGDEDKRRVLGDEWLDWTSDHSDREIKESKNTFLLLSLVVLVAFVLLAFLMWYLILPRFELFGQTWASIITVTFVALSSLLILWYTILLIAILSHKHYFKFCMNRGTFFFITILPIVTKLANIFGISRDRLGHSFIKVSNEMVNSSSAGGLTLVLLPRCLNKDLKKEIKDICSGMKDLVLYTAPGGNVARKIINDTKPDMIIAMACERDLVSGIQDIAPKIPVIGIPNSRPTGPCKNTFIDLSEFRYALEQYHQSRHR